MSSYHLEQQEQTMYPGVLIRKSQPQELLKRCRFRKINKQVLDQIKPDVMARNNKTCFNKTLVEN